MITPQDIKTLPVEGEGKRSLAVKYLKAFSGDGIRLFIQLFYFYLVANTLTIAEFGLFATASSIGIVLSRLAGFGFLSPLYRIATVKPRLIGVYTAGYLLALMLSLPLVVLISWSVHALFFAGLMPLVVFAMIVGTEVLCWRTLEAVINVNKGLEKFGLASIVIVFGFSVKALAALFFALSAEPDLGSWALIYLISQALMAASAIVLFYPRKKLRFVPKLYKRRIPDALSVSGAEVLFYVQNELDKLVVLAVGGSTAAGLYSIIMRLVDLTAMPVRTFSTLLTQRLMRKPQLMNSIKMRVGFEAGVFCISVAAIACIALALHIKPDLLGNNVAQVAPYMAIVLLVPAFRNLIEYQAELLYGRGQSFQRLLNYFILGILKAVLLVWLLATYDTPAEWMIWINGVFAVLYAASLLLTYTSLKKPAIRI
ncbi:lipopolysaccharide biosynthesis protein [Ahrensia marina]|uniref:lipopolysaccharide biosynthesis protein n=1 Tax=Ahrensia marina TaxID=1514904 RepID=UPI001FE1C054|nr:lipopolysaccharide biosynthesis protein [Ahrensia marina]